MRTILLPAISLMALLGSVAQAQPVLSSFAPFWSERQDIFPDRGTGLHSGPAPDSAVGRDGYFSFFAGFGWDRGDVDKTDHGFIAQNEWAKYLTAGHESGWHAFAYDRDFGFRHGRDSDEADRCGAPFTGSPIPEPSTYAALLGLTALGFAIRRGRSGILSKCSERKSRAGLT